MLVAVLVRERVGQVAPASPAADPRRPLPRGTQLGRYLILDFRGAGAMGAVYAAYDPDLDRRIALKLLRQEDPERLSREAQAMARVQDPNVVTIHDVGEVDGTVYLAMELVDGTTLRGWLAARPRARHEILTIFRFAGKGLAAAHRALLVHRDFKPENVLVASDGRVRVTDFGLARADEGDDGGLAGTPAYMAPEQLRRHRADARSDQFGFCVALYEALWGARPFAGDDLKELTDAIVAGRMTEPPAARQAPRWLRRAVLRGLQPDPEDRWPSIDALLAELQRHERRSRTGWLAVGALGLVGLGAAFLLQRGRSDEVCHGGRAALAGVWDGPRRDAMRVAFHATGKPYADEAWRHASTMIDAYAERWITMRDASCAATRRGEQSAALLDLRTACLDERRTDLGALTGLLVKVDADAVERAPAAAAELPTLERCADARTLLARVPPPSAQAAVRIAELGTRLAQARALLSFMRLDDAMAIDRAVVEEARALPFRSLEAEALLLEANIETAHFRAQEAEEALASALAAAQEAHDDELVARAAMGLHMYWRELRGRYDEARLWGRLAAATIERLGRREDLVARLEANLAGTELRAGHPDDALAHAARGRAALDTGPYYYPSAQLDLELTTALAEQQLGDVDAAIAALERARAAAQGMYGSTSSGYIEIENDLGAILLQRYRVTEAIPHLERALAGAREVFGLDHFQTLQVRNNLATALALSGRGQEARAAQEEILAIVHHTLGADSVQAIEVEVSLGETLAILGRDAEALAHFEEARRLAEASGGPAAIEPGLFESDVADALVHLGRASEALALLRPLARSLDPQRRTRGGVLTSLANAMLALGDPYGAVPPLEEALALRAQDPFGLAETRFALARALAAGARDDAQARALARAARDAFATLGGFARQVAEIDAWLGAHP
jgi:tetratricopeptide (TPR) repeat protein